MDTEELGTPSDLAEFACHTVANPMSNGEVVRADGTPRTAPK